MKNHVTTLEISKRLKEKGYPQSSELCWTQKNKVIETLAAHRFGEFKCSAPLATELLEQLPAYLEKEKTDEKDSELWMLTMAKFNGSGGRTPYYVTYELHGGHLYIHQHSDSLPDALAEMWIYLKENNLL